MHPGARRAAVVATGSAAVRISVTAAPERGRANEAMLAVLADALGVRRAQLELVRGTHSRTKQVSVRGVTPTELAVRLAALAT